MPNFIIVQSNLPFNHTADDEATAIATAEKLAQDEQGATFDVYERLASSAAPAPVKVPVPVDTVRHK